MFVYAGWALRSSLASYQFFFFLSGKIFELIFFLITIWFLLPTSFSVFTASPLFLSSFEKSESSPSESSSANF